MSVSRRATRPTWRLPGAIAALCLLAIATPAHATFHGQDGKIAFQGNLGGVGGTGVDVFSINPDGTERTQLTNNPASDLTPAWSPDGTKIAFASNRDGNYEIYTMNAAGSGQTRITNNPADDLRPDWSPDGTKLAFSSNRDGPNVNQEIYTMNVDGTSPVRLTNNAAAVDTFPAWSPDGTEIAFQSDRGGSFDIYKMSADGTGQANLSNGFSTDNQRPNWAEVGPSIYFDGIFSGSPVIRTMDADGTPTNHAFTSNGIRPYAPSPSPSSGRLAFVLPPNIGIKEIFVCGGSGCNTNACTTSGGGAGCDQISFNMNGEYPDWQAVPWAGYARPRGASPFRASLVPAYAACGANAVGSSHRGSISSASCVPPTPESEYLTVGTPDFNGVGANSIGSVLFRVRTTTPEDISIAVSDTDVRCAGTSVGCPGGAPSDYAGDLRFDTSFRITDKGNGVGLTGDPGTVGDLPVRFSVPCATTVSTTVGSTCSVNTTINTLLGSSAIVASQRAIWQLNGDLKLYDGGADAVASTTGDNTLFAVGGLFAP